MSAPNPNTEEYRFSGEELVSRIKELVHEGNIRRIIIKNEEGRSLIEIPLTLGVIGAALLPVWAAVGAIAAMAANYTVVVERTDEQSTNVTSTYAAPQGPDTLYGDQAGPRGEAAAAGAR